jgi:hypothetical protein
MIIGHYEHEIWAKGGIASYIRRVGAAQIALGHQVYYFSQQSPLKSSFINKPSFWDWIFCTCIVRSIQCQLRDCLQFGPFMVINPTAPAGLDILAVGKSPAIALTVFTVVSGGI